MFSSLAYGPFLCNYDFIQITSIILLSPSVIIGLLSCPCIMNHFCYQRSRVSRDCLASLNCIGFLFVGVFVLSVIAETYFMFFYQDNFKNILNPSKNMQDNNNSHCHKWPLSLLIDIIFYYVLIVVFIFFWALCVAFNKGRNNI